MHAGGTGGAIHADGAKVEIHTSIFHGNSAGAKGNGGAISINTGTKVEIHTSTFQKNSGPWGGGVLYLSGTGANVTIHSSIFKSNSAGSKLEEVKSYAGDLRA
jgi:hypothetical protein